MSLWIVTVLTLLTATYPRWASSVGLGNRSEARAGVVTPGRAVEVATLDVHGMTCADCEQHIVDELRRVPGVIDAHVSYATENAVVEVGNAVDLSAVRAAVERAGYRATNLQRATQLASH